MEYRAVGNRCAINIDLIQNLPISCVQALIVLQDKGFRIIEVDLIALARQCIDTSKYRRGAKKKKPPLW